MAAQIHDPTARIELLDRVVVAAVKADEKARRPTSIPGVGPIIATTVETVVHDPADGRPPKVNLVVTMTTNRKETT